ncbi:MAG: tetratricopeptide repeat protein [Bradymonadaceae bacterium]
MKALLCVLAALIFIGAHPDVAHAQSLRSVDSSSPRFEDAWAHGDYETLRRLAQEYDDTPSLLARAWLSEMEGDLVQAGRFARAARQVAVSPSALVDADVAIAHYLRITGEWDEAEARLRKTIADHPALLPARLALGELLLERGDRSEAEIILETISNAYNQGRIDQSRDFASLGRALGLLGSYSDASYAFTRALRAEPHDLRARLFQGQLFLSRYNTAEAERAFKTILDQNPNHPDALVSMAKLEMTSDRDFDAAREYLMRARRVASGHPGIQLIEAELAIYDGDCHASLEFTSGLLDHRPKDLRALSLKAACHYILDDTEAYDAVRTLVDGIRKNDSRLLVETARFATLFHRYDEAVAIYREALKRVPDDPDALVGLGIGLSRTGHEEEALVVLRRAFAADSYHVRAYNMLEFYEKAMPDYVFVDHDRFSLRAHKSQYDVIEKLAVPVVEEALEEFNAKYRFEPDPYLAVEIYADAQAFAVRSVGLPNISPHGICFGKVVLSRSPSDGNFNWRQVLWHEMAHVYHLQIADSRMPRWFTEGLAEYETNVKDASWIRHHDQDIARAVFAGEVPSVLNLDKGFTHARSLYEMVVAYQLSSFAIHFIVENHGFDAIVAMLEAWGERLTNREVMEKVLKQTPKEFDAAFLAWLEHRYRFFANQMATHDPPPEPLDTLQAMVQSMPGDGYIQARLAMAHLRQGDAPSAKRELARAMGKAPDDVRVRWIAARMMLHMDRPADAYEHGQAILELHRDAYDLRVLMARAAMMREESVAAEVHFGAATELYPNGREAWQGLFGLARSRDDVLLAERALRRLFALDQNDPTVARRFAESALEAKTWDEACAAGERWLDIQPFEADSARAMGRAGLACGKEGQAAQAFELLLLLEARRVDEAYVWIVRQLTEAGFEDKAQEWAKRAREHGVDSAAIDDAATD